MAEWVLAIGNPYQLGQTVTLGIVSGMNRTYDDVSALVDYIQTDAAINPGNSGGALINRRGELVGINTWIYSQSGGDQGIGFAIPSNIARRVADELIKTGEITRGSIGVMRLASDDAGARARPGPARYERRARLGDGPQLVGLSRRPAPRRRRRLGSTASARRRPGAAAACPARNPRRQHGHRSSVIREGATIRT